MVRLVFKIVNGSDVEIDAPLGDSVMEAATAVNVPGIDADCGGSMICGTCHVQVDPEAQAQLPEQSAAELALLENVPEPRPNTRLTCQIPVTQALEGLVMKVPETQR